MRHISNSGLNRTGTLQHLIEFALFTLEVRIATDVLLLEEDVGHATLAREVLERILECGAVFYNHTLATILKMSVGS